MTISDPPGWSASRALRRPATLVLLLVALVTRLGYGAWADFPEKDTLVYDELAVNLLTQGEYRFEGDGGLPYRSPGYPLFLAGLYAIAGQKNHTAVKVAQAILDLVAGMMLLGIGRRLGLREAIALGGMGLFLLNPFTISYSAIVISETLTTFFVVCALWMLFVALDAGRRWSLVAFGAAASAAALTRPIFALLPAVLLLHVLVTRRVTPKRWVEWCVLAVAGFLVVWAPWAVRNAVRGTFLPYNVGHIHRPGYNGWVGTWALTMQDVYRGVWDTPPRPPPRAYRSEADRTEVEALLAERSGLDPASPGAGARLEAIDARFAALRLERIREAPLSHYVVRPIIRAFAMWFTGNSTFLAQANVPLSEIVASARSRPIGLALKLTGLAAWLVFPLFSAPGWWRLRRMGSVSADLPIVVAVYCTVLTCAITVLRPSFQVWMEARYVVEALPGLSLLVAVGLAWLWERVNRSRRAEPA